MSHPRTPIDKYKSGKNNGRIFHFHDREHIHFGGDNAEAHKDTVSLGSAGRYKISIFQKGVRREPKDLRYTKEQF
jgi:hypothetical protein